MSKHYAINSFEEAQAYLNHPILGARLLECSETLRDIEKRSALQILGSPDDRKLQSSMTLFAHVAGSNSVYGKVLDKYFSGEQDPETLRRLNVPGGGQHEGPEPFPIKWL